MKLNDNSDCSVFTGRFKDIYHDYKYTYQACGILLIVSSFILFAGMGLNYRLLNKEKKEEERRARVGGSQRPRDAVETRNIEDPV